MTNDTAVQTPQLDIIIRVEKLMAQAADKGCTEEERDSFQRKAAELIERHRIDRSLIGGHLKADDVITTLTVGKFDGVYGRVRIDLANAVLAAFDCKVFWQGYKNERTLRGYGFKSDLELSIALVNRLLADADLRVQAVQAGYVDMYNAENGTYYKSRQGAVMAARLAERRGFYMGYASAVRDRLAAAKTAAEAGAVADGVDVHSTALVLVDRKRQVNDAYRERYGNLKAAGHINGAGHAGRQAGQQAGSQVSLAHQNEVRGQRALGR